MTKIKASAIKPVSMGVVVDLKVRTIQGVGAAIEPIPVAVNDTGLFFSSHFAEDDRKLIWVIVGARSHDRRAKCLSENILNALNLL